MNQNGLKPGTRPKIRLKQKANCDQQPDMHQTQN